MIKICEILDSLVFLFKKKKIKNYTYLVCTGGGQGTTCGNWFSSFTMWILGTKKIMSPGLASFTPLESLSVFLICFVAFVGSSTFGLSLCPLMNFLQQ